MFFRLIVSEAHVRVHNMASALDYIISNATQK